MCELPVVEKLFDGELIIETRDKTTQALRARFRSKQKNRIWERRTLHTEDIAIAREKAKKIFVNYHARIEAGLPSDLERTFKQVCEAYKKRLSDLEASGVGKVTHKSYISIIDNWLIPILGKKPISTIDDAAIDEFEQKRLMRAGKMPAKSTVNHHNVVLRAVLDYAAIKKYIPRSSIPKMTVKDKGRKPKRRPRFMPEEMEQLIEFLKRWPYKGIRSETVYKRQLLCYYVQFLYYTGCRPGNELEELRWKQIDWETGKVKIDFTHTKNEKHRRRIVADSRIFDAVELLSILTHPVAPEHYVFRMTDGRKATGFSEMFASALTEAGMRYNALGDGRSLYSIRHAFASEKIIDGKVTREKLAHHMGTSWQMLEQYYVDLHDELNAEEFSNGDIDIFDQDEIMDEIFVEIEKDKAAKRKEERDRWKQLTEE